MGVTIFRPGQRLVIPGQGVQVWSPRPVIASGGWWNNYGAISGCVAAYAAKGAASLAASYINLTGNATYNAAPGSAPTWDSTGGWTFNGSTQYLTTGIIPGSGWSAIIRYSNAVTTNGFVFGSRGSGGTENRFRISPVDESNAIGYGSGGFLFVSPSLAAGIVAIAGSTAYRNGTAEPGSPMAAWIGTGAAIAIGASNTDGSITGHTNCKIQALAIYSTTLSGADVATLTTAINAL